MTFRAGALGVFLELPFAMTTDRPFSPTMMGLAQHQFGFKAARLSKSDLRCFTRRS
jgi:hypothetical protein